MTAPDHPAPGHPLVLAGNIEPYLDSASRSPRVLEALLLVGEVRTLLANARPDTTDPQSLGRDLLPRLVKVADLLEASPAVGSDRDALAHFRQKVSDTLGTSAVPEDPSSAHTDDGSLSPGTMADILDPLKKSAHELSSQLRRLYRAGETRRESFQPPSASEDDRAGGEWEWHNAGAQTTEAALDWAPREGPGDLERAKAAHSPTGGQGGGVAVTKPTSPRADHGQFERGQSASRRPSEHAHGYSANDLEGRAARQDELVTEEPGPLRFGAERVPGVMEYLKEMALSQSDRRHHLRVRLQDRILSWASGGERRVTLSYAERANGNGQESRIALLAEPGCPGWGSTCPPTIDDSTAWGRSVLNLVTSDAPKIRICRSRRELEQTPGYEATAREPDRFPAYALIPMVAKDQAVTIGTLEVEARDQLGDVDATELIAMASVLACAKVLETTAIPDWADAHA